MSAQAFWQSLCLWFLGTKENGIRCRHSSSHLCGGAWLFDCRMWKWTRMWVVLIAVIAILFLACCSDCLSEWIKPVNVHVCSSQFGCLLMSYNYAVGIYSMGCRLSVCLSFFRHGCIVAKRCEIGPWLLLITNRKSHIGFQTTWKSLTLDDFEGHRLWHVFSSDSWAFLFLSEICEKVIEYASHQEMFENCQTNIFQENTDSLIISRLHICSVSDCLCSALSYSYHSFVSLLYCLYCWCALWSNCIAEAGSRISQRPQNGHWWL